jgi:DNA-binding CsgD family transcriptional regulator
MPPPASTLPDDLFALWQTLTGFPAGETDAALGELMHWIARRIDADNVIWIGAVRVLRGPAAKTDPFLGWRLRARRPLHPDSKAYREQLARYYLSEHYGKRTSTFYARSHEEKKDAHIGMTGHASLAGAGRFRVHRLRDGWIDFDAFRRTPHYRIYYRDAGIVDRMTIGFPVSADTESFLLIDRWRRTQGPHRRPFTQRDAAVAGAAVQGAPELHRRILLTHGLFVGDKPLSPTERQILQRLLTGQTEKEIAHATGQKPATLHKYVTSLYAQFGVKSRAALMALWLGGA